MKNTITLLVICIYSITGSYAQYTRLPIPDTLVTAVDPLSGYKTYDLTIHEGFTNFLHTGNLTITHGYNQYNFLGPTLIMHEGDNVQMSVYNETNDPTTVHWHGIHLPPVMDGGPHQVIGSGATWKPYWRVSDSASTYWYHAHLDFETDSLVTMGQAGLIIVKDDQEAALPLPRTYGKDDIPVIMADRQIVPATNQLQPIEAANYEITNGVVNALAKLPPQVVRLRLLNASTYRAYNLGLSSDSLHRTDTFYVIASDGGLLNAPVMITPADTFIMSPGERYEILVNLTGRAPGTLLHFIAFNSGLPYGVPGAPLPPPPPPMTQYPSYITSTNDSFRGKNFQVLAISVDTFATPGAITSIPAALKTNNFPDPSVVSGRPHITFTYAIEDSVIIQPMMQLNGLPFQMGVNNVIVPLGSTEEWRIANTQIIQVVPLVDTALHIDTFLLNITSHVFHIHDVQFKIVSITDTVTGLSRPIPAYQQGWKDVIMVDYPQVVKYIARFDDFADPAWPYMYHCHMLKHEDQAMMAQFIVVDTARTRANTIGPSELAGARVYPNPATDRIHIDLDDKTASIYYATIFDIVGRKKLMLPKPMTGDGTDVSALAPGEYLIKMVDTNGNISYAKFTKL